MKTIEKLKENEKNAQEIVKNAKKETKKFVDNCTHPAKHREYEFMSYMPWSETPHKLRYICKRCEKSWVECTANKVGKNLDEGLNILWL
jgi:hypothetical protein